MPKAFLKTDSIADSITAIYDGKDLNLTKTDSITDSASTIYSKDLKLY